LIPLAEEILSQSGFELLYLKQIKTLALLLGKFSEVTILAYPWLSYYYGACLQDSSPSEALPFLRNAQTLFSQQGNEYGILLSNSQLVEFHTIVDGQFNLMAEYLVSLETVFERQKDYLLLPQKMKMLHALALGHCFLQSDMEKVELYDTMALQLCLANGLDNMSAAIRLIRAYRHGFVGNMKGCREEIEESFSEMHNPLVTTLNKFFLTTLQVNLLEMEGDFVNYRHQKKFLEQVAEQDVVTQSVISPFLYIWDIDSALAENDIDTAELLIVRGLQSCYAFSKAHMRSQLLHYHALLLALRKKKKEALQAAQESLALRQQVGANAHVLLNHQVLGAAFAQLGMYQEAKEHFAKAMNLSQELGEEFQRCSVLTHRAWMYLQQGEEEQALRDVVHCLHFMKKNEYIHFFSFIPQVVEPILVLALRHSIETDYVLKLLAERFDKGVTPGGTPIPLIDISLLGKTTLSVTENRQQNAYELTEIERHLFFILAASHGLQREHSLISLRLWPDKDAERQRSSLDTLLSQIRKKLGRLVSPVKAKEYLTVERGVVKLKNCRIDVMEFLQHARRGRHCVRQEKHWQACNSFYRAFRFWKGAGLLGLTVEDSELFQQDVEQEFCLSAKIYASLLQEQKKNEQACELLKTVFRHFPQDAELARQLFDLYSRSGNHAQAQHILQHYKQVHQQVSEDAQDVEEAMCAFWQEFPDNE
ncbi:MAG: tetratricopeptide repeat protein, partial [Proteobacteria bacterium]|nr:tetratricopeptide repeat protein [Pseudomonadota bacterium]